MLLPLLPHQFVEWRPGFPRAAKKSPQVCEEEYCCFLYTGRTLGLWQNARIEILCLAEEPRTPSKESGATRITAGGHGEIVQSPPSTVQVLHNHEPRLGVFAQMCVAPFVAWRPRSRPSGRPLRSTAPTLMAMALRLLAATASQRAGDPDCFVFVRSGTHDGQCV